MNSNNLNMRNISLSKTKQERDILLNPNSQRETISAAKSLIKDKKLNKSHVKETEKSPLMKLTTKTNFDNFNLNNNKKRDFNLYANKDIKKNLTHKLFAQINNNNNNNLNIKQTQTIINNIKKFDIINDNNNNKENKYFKIKVKKVFDLNELMTLHNITNDNTTSSNKNDLYKTFEKFENLKHSIPNKLEKEEFKDEESDCYATEKKVAKDLETRKSLILKEFPIFKNSFIINENASFTNNQIDIETLPNMKYSEVDSLDESCNDNASNSSSINKNIKNNLHKSKKINENPTEKRDEKDIDINNDKYLSLEENANDDLNDNSVNEKHKKSGTTIKETFTLFLQNNSKKEFLNEENSVDGKEEKEKSRSNFKNKTLTMTDNNTNSAFRNIAINQNIKLRENIRKTAGIERNNLAPKLSNNFYSPQKNRMRFCKTKNILSSFSNSIANFNHYNNNGISELSQKVANCDSMLSHIELNKKLKSEAEILSEKVKTLKKIQQNKNHEIEILKSKYSEAIESYKCEIEKNKKLKERIDKQNSVVKNLKKNFKILANNLVELTELLLLSKTSAEKRASLIAADNASLSIDIYDSYNNEEEKKSLLQEQIQSLLLAKFYYFKKQLSLDLEAEIDRIKNWNNNPNFLFSGKNNNSNNNVNNSNNTNNNNNNIEMSISNIKITALNKNNENDSFESSSKKNISQDYFDLSISNQFLNLNQIPSGNFGNLGSNINININQSPQFFFTNNNYNSKKNPHNNSFGVIDVESENIFGSNSNKNYSSNANNYNNNNLNLNLNASNNAIINANNNLLNNYFSNKEKSSSSNLKNISNFGSKEHNNNNFNNSNSNSNNKKNNWKLIFNKEEQMDINNSNWNKLNYNSNNREDKFRIDSINNLIGANGFNKNVALSSNYNSNSNNIFDSFLQSAKGPNDSFSNSANDSILQIVNLNNANSDKENKQANKSNKFLPEVEILNDIANDSLEKVSNTVNLKEQITKIQNDSYNFMFEESKARSENYNSDNETKKKFICDELVNNNNYSNNNNEIENFKDNFSEKNDGNKLKRMFSFEL